MVKMRRKFRALPFPIETVHVQQHQCPSGHLVAHSTQEQVDNLGDLYPIGPCNYIIIPTLHVMACKQHPEYHCHKRLFDVLQAAVAT